MDTLTEELIGFAVNSLLDNPKEILLYATEYFGGKVNANAETDSSLSSTSSPYMARRGIVYGVAYNPESDEENSKESESTTTNSQENMLVEECGKSVLFKFMDEETLMEIVRSMRRIHVCKGDIIMEGGEVGDKFYIVEKGVFEVWIGKKNSKLMKIYSNKGSFGEVALLYNKPMNETVKAITDGVLWALRAHTFRHLIIKATLLKKSLYEKALKTCHLLRTLTDIERKALVDAFQSKIFNKGEIIIKQGAEVGGMYVIEKGSVEVFSTDEKSRGKRNFKLLKSGHYFGELAFVKKRPCAVSAVAASEKVQVAFLEVDAFERLVGQFIDLIKRDGQGNVGMQYIFEEKEIDI